MSFSLPTCWQVMLTPLLLYIQVIGYILAEISQMGKSRPSSSGFCVRQVTTAIQRDSNPRLRWGSKVALECKSNEALYQDQAQYPDTDEHQKYFPLVIAHRKAETVQNSDKVFSLEHHRLCTFNSEGVVQSTIERTNSSVLYSGSSFRKAK